MKGIIMRPHQPIKKASGISRAKMFMKNELGWLTGFPARDGKWTSVPENSESEVVVIDRNVIHRATYTISKLKSDFPKALPQIVGNVDQWTRGYLTLLDIFKGVVHENRVFPASVTEIHPNISERDKSTARELGKRYHDLTPVINSFCSFFQYYPH